MLMILTEHTYLWKEKGTTIRPRVVLTSMRMRALWKEAEADMKAGEFDRTTGDGPRLEAKLSEMEKEDAALFNEDGTRKNKEAGDGPKFRPLNDSEGRGYWTRGLARLRQMGLEPPKPPRRYPLPMLVLS